MKPLDEVDHNSGRSPATEGRPQIEPDCFSWRELPDDQGGVRAFLREMGETWRGKVEHARFTMVSDDHPHPPYPNGLYFEGWSKAPWKHDPPGEAAPFNYPLANQGKAQADE